MEGTAHLQLAIIRGPKHILTAAILLTKKRWAGGAYCSAECLPGMCEALYSNSALGFKNK